LSELTPEARANRDFWNRTADSYQERNRDHISRPEPRWGLWQLPESELRILGDLTGKDVLELGCGAAQWSIVLAGLGVRVTGLDNSERQLEHARENMAAAGVEFPLVHGSADAVPLPDASFDVVFCDWGAMSFADPRKTVPEAARLLRPGGTLAFSGGTAIDWLAFDEEADAPGERLLRDYFGLHRWQTKDGSVEFMLPYGEWIALFRANGLAVERLLEVCPPEGAPSTYRTAQDTAWARRWPIEQIWVLRKE
jgi:SAM-dependent methyltransferase